MELSQQRDLFTLLEAELRGMEMKTAVLPGGGSPQLGDTLRVLLGITERVIPVITELMVFGLRDGACLLQLYTTLTDSIGEGRGDELQRAIPLINFYCPLGSFGIYTGGQLYHKYTVVLEEGRDSAALAECVLNTLAALYTVLDDYGGLSLSIAGGELSLDQAQASGLLPVL